MTSEYDPQSGEERKMLDQSSSPETSRLTIARHYPSTSAEIVLESMEECIGCIDGIKEQQTFEESLLAQTAHQRQIAMEYGLSEAEPALIRLQIDDATAATSMATSAANGIRSAMEDKPGTSIIYPQLEDILEKVCRVQGSNSSCLSSTISHNCDDGASKGTVRSGDDPLVTDLCQGVILPMDTTLPTSLPGNALVESRQRKVERSLVDVAAEDDSLQEVTEEETFSVDVEAINECAISGDSIGTCGD